MAARPRRRVRPERILSPAILERRLRYALIRGRGGRQVVLAARRFKPTSNTAASVHIKDPWERGHHALTLNLMWKGAVPGVIHELCHLDRRRMLKPWGAFEEGIVLKVLEEEVCSYIAADPKLVEWWDGAIDLKLTEEDA